jgi:hypothetical protein
MKRTTQRIPSPALAAIPADCETRKVRSEFKRKNRPSKPGQLVNGAHPHQALNEGQTGGNRWNLSGGDDTIGISFRLVR